MFIVDCPWGDDDEIFHFTLLEDGLHEGRPSGDCGPDPQVVPSILTGESTVEQVLEVLAAWYPKAREIFCEAPCPGGTVPAERLADYKAAADLPIPPELREELAELANNHLFVDLDSAGDSNAFFQQYGCRVRSCYGNYPLLAKALVEWGYWRPIDRPHPEMLAYPSQMSPSWGYYEVVKQPAPKGWGPDITT